MTDHTQDRRENQDWLEDTIRREGDVLFSTHPTAKDLVLHTEARTEMPDTEHRRIEAHLRVCAECADDRARLVNAAAELQEGQRPPRVALSLGLVQRLRQWLAPAHWIPAVVAVAVTVVVLLPRTDTPIVHPVGRAVVLRGDVERGALPTVIPAADGRLTLSFVLPGTGEGAIVRCDVTIAAAAGPVVATVPGVVAFDDYGTFVLTIDVRDLDAGSYTLTAQDRIGPREFSFDLQHPSGAIR